MILEDLRSQFMAFGEGQDVLSRKTDNLEAGQDALSQKIDNLEIKVDSIDERLIRIEDNVAEIKHRLSEKVDLEDFQKLEIRLIKLEKIVFQKI